MSLSVRIPKPAMDLLRALAEDRYTSVTTALVSMIRDEAERRKVGSFKPAPKDLQPKRRANARPKKLPLGSTYEHPTGTIYVSWAGFSRLGYIRSNSDIPPGLIPVPTRTDQDAERWAERNPPGEPESYIELAWVRDPVVGDLVPPVPDPNKP